MSATTLTTTPARYDSPEAAELVAELQAEYVRRYGDGDSTPVTPEDFEPPDGLFLLVHLGEEVIGSMAMRRHVPGPGEDPAVAAGLDHAVVEFKRLYVREGHRRRGHARRVLRLAEERAAALGYGRAVLETGTEQPEAMALYASEGYDRIPTYGHYADAPLSRCFAKTLLAAPPR